MTETVEPNWIEVWEMTTFPGYIEHIDANARPGSRWQWRHKPAKHTGEADPKWRPGRAPQGDPDQY